MSNRPLLPYQVQAMNTVVAVLERQAKEARAEADLAELEAVVAECVADSLRRMLRGDSLVLWMEPDGGRYHLPSKSRHGRCGAHSDLYTTMKLAEVPKHVHYCDRCVILETREAERTG